MIDPVSAELIEREQLHLPWRRALLGALALHGLAATVLLIGGRHRPRPLFLPKVQVRIGALPIAVTAPPAAAAPGTSSSLQPNRR